MVDREAGHVAAGEPLSMPPVREALPLVLLCLRDADGGRNEWGRKNEKGVVAIYTWNK